MSLRPFVPPTFSVGLVALGAVLMLLPSMRIAGLVALLAAAAYWLLFAILKALRR